MNQNLAIKVYSKIGKMIFERNLDISTEPVTYCGIEKLPNLTILDLKKILNYKIQNLLDNTFEKVALSSVIFDNKETQDMRIGAALMDALQSASVFGSLSKFKYVQQIKFLRFFVFYRPISKSGFGIPEKTSRLWIGKGTHVRWLLEGSRGQLCTNINNLSTSNFSTIYWSFALF